MRRILAGGTAISGRRVVLLHSPGAGGVAVVAGRRIGSAVERNRARRILRAAWREVAAGVRGDSDVVLVARPPIRGAGARDLMSEMTELLERADLIRG